MGTFRGSLVSWKETPQCWLERAPPAHGLTLPEAAAHDAGPQMLPSQNPGQSTRPARRPRGPSRQEALRANVLGCARSPGSGTVSVSTALCPGSRMLRAPCGAAVGSWVPMEDFRVGRTACFPSLAVSTLWALPAPCGLPPRVAASQHLHAFSWGSCLQPHRGGSHTHGASAGVKARSPAHFRRLGCEQESTSKLEVSMFWKRG